MAANSTSDATADGANRLVSVGAMQAWDHGERLA